MHRDSCASTLGMTTGTVASHMQQKAIPLSVYRLCTDHKHCLDSRNHVVAVRHYGMAG